LRVVFSPFCPPVPRYTPFSPFSSWLVRFGSPSKSLFCPLVTALFFSPPRGLGSPLLESCFFLSPMLGSPVHVEVPSPLVRGPFSGHKNVCQISHAIVNVTAGSPAFQFFPSLFPHGLSLMSLSPKFVLTFRFLYFPESFFSPSVFFLFLI